MNNDGEIKRHTAYKLSAGLISKAELHLEQDEEDATKQRLRFMSLAGKEINRVNLIANIVDKFQSDEKRYSTLTLDDGTGNIHVRAFSDNAAILNRFNPGDTVLVIGVPRYFNNDIYILPEIVKVVDARWLIARKLELEKEYGDLYRSANVNVEPEEWAAKEEQTMVPSTNSETGLPEEQPELVESIRIGEEREAAEGTDAEEVKQTEMSLRERIVDMIKASEAEEGIDIDKIILGFNSHKVEEINMIITALLEEGTIYEPRPGRLRIL
ncbi:MAG: hypothetical protein K6T16_00080 [Candidatus Pacearchaeota archaeon]|nr:hypothetical protein [Candidatus Pacearchaeota archaeon]